MAEGWPVQVQSSQSIPSAMVPLAKAASSAGTFRPSEHQMVASAAPPLLWVYRITFSVMGRG